MAVKVGDTVTDKSGKVGTLYSISTYADGTQVGNIRYGTGKRGSTNAFVKNISVVEPSKQSDSYLVVRQGGIKTTYANRKDAERMVKNQKFGSVIENKKSGNKGK